MKSGEKRVINYIWIYTLQNNNRRKLSKILYCGCMLAEQLNICKEHPIIYSVPTPDFWELLTEEQNRKIAIMRLNVLINKEHSDKF